MNQEDKELKKLLEKQAKSLSDDCIDIQVDHIKIKFDSTNNIDKQIIGTIKKILKKHRDIIRIIIGRDGDFFVLYIKGIKIK